MRHLRAADAQQVLVDAARRQTTQVQRAGHAHPGAGDAHSLHPVAHGRRGHRHAGLFGDVQRDVQAGGVGEIDEQVGAGAHRVGLVVDDHRVLGVGGHAAGEGDAADLRLAGAGGLAGAAAGAGDGVDRCDGSLRHTEGRVHRIGDKQHAACADLDVSHPHVLARGIAGDADGDRLGAGQDPQHAVGDLNGVAWIGAVPQGAQQIGDALGTVGGTLAGSRRIARIGRRVGGHGVDDSVRTDVDGVGADAVERVAVEVDAAGARHADRFTPLDQAVERSADGRPTGGHGRGLVAGAVAGVQIDGIGQLLRNRGQRVAGPHGVAERIATDGDAEQHVGAHRQAGQADAAPCLGGRRDIGARRLDHRRQALSGDRDRVVDRVDTAAGGVGDGDHIARQAGIDRRQSLDGRGQLGGQRAAAGIDHGGRGRADADDVLRTHFGNQAGQVHRAGRGGRRRDAGRAQVGHRGPVERIDGDGTAAAAGHPDPGVVANRDRVLVAVDDHRVALAAGRADTIVESDHAALLDLAAGGRGRRAATIAERTGADDADRLDGRCRVDGEGHVGRACVQVQGVGRGIHRGTDGRVGCLDRQRQAAQQRGHGLAGQGGDRCGHAVDGDGVDLAGGREAAEADAAALRPIGAGLPGGGGAHRRRQAPGALGRGIGHLPVGVVDGDAQRRRGGGDHPHFQLVAGAGVGGRPQDQRWRHRRADDGDGEADQIGRSLVIGLGHQIAPGIDDARRQLRDHAAHRRLDRHRAGRLARAGVCCGLDQVDAQVAARAHFGHVGHPVDEGAHFACIDVAAGLDAHRTVAGGGTLDHQAIGFTHHHIAVDRAVGHQGGDQRVQHDVAAGGDLQAVGDEHRRAVGHHLGGLDQDVAAVRRVGVDDAALHRQRAADQQVDIGRRAVARQAPDKARQREAAAQVEVDVTPGPQLEAGRGQRSHADVDEAGVLQALVFLDGVEDVAIAVVVDAEQGFGEGVQAVAVVVEVDAEAGFVHHVQRIAVAVEVASERGFGHPVGVIAVAVEVDRRLMQRVEHVAVAVEVASQRGLADEVIKAAVVVEVDAQAALDQGVAEVAVVVAVPAHAHLDQAVGAAGVAVQVDAALDLVRAAGGDDQTVDQAVAVSGDGADAAAQDHVLAGDQFQALAGRQLDTRGGVVQAERAAGLQDQGVGAQPGGQGLGQRAVAGDDVAGIDHGRAEGEADTGAVLHPGRCIEESVQLHIAGAAGRSGGGREGHPAVVDQTVVDRGCGRRPVRRPGHHHRAGGAGQADEVGPHDAGAPVGVGGDGGGRHPQRAHCRQRHLVGDGRSRAGAGGQRHPGAFDDETATHFQRAVGFVQHDVAGRGEPGIQAVDRHLDVGDAGGRLQRQAVGHQVHSGIDTGLEDAAAGDQRDIAGRADIGGRCVADVVGVTVGVAVHPRCFAGVRQVDAGRHPAHQDVATGIDQQIIGVVVGQQVHPLQVDHAAGADGQGAIGDAGGAVGGATQLVDQALPADHQLARAHLRQLCIACALGHQHGGVDIAAQVDQQQARCAALLRRMHPQLIGAQPGARLADHRALHRQADVAAAGVGQVAQAQIGRRAAHRPGDQHQVVGIARAQRGGRGHREIAEAGDADGAVVGLGKAQRQRTAGIHRRCCRRGARALVTVDDPDVAGTGQFGTGDGVDMGLQADAGLGHGVQVVGPHHALDHGFIEIVGGIAGRAVAVDGGDRGLGDGTRGRAQTHRGAAGVSRQGGGSQADVATVGAGGQHQVAAGGAQLGAAVGGDGAVARLALAGAQGDGAGDDGAAQVQVAVGQQLGTAERGAAGRAHVAGHAQQFTGQQPHAGGGLASGLRAQHLGRSVQAEGGCRGQGHRVGRHPGGQLAHAARQHVAAEIDQRTGVDAQRVHGRHPAAQRHMGAGVDEHVAAADRVAAAFATALFRGVVDLGDHLHLGGVDRALFPHRHVLHRLDLHLLGAGLEDGAVVVHRLGLGAQCVAELHPLVEQRLVLLHPVVAVVLEVLVAVTVGLETGQPVVADQVVAESTVAAIEGFALPAVTHMLEHLDHLGLPTQGQRAGLVVEPAHAGAGKAVHRVGGAAVTVLVEHRSVVAVEIGIARRVAHVDAVTRAGGARHVAQALHLVGGKGVDIVGRADDLVAGAHAGTGTGRNVEADGEVAVPLVVGDDPVDVVIDAVEADDAVAFADVDHMAARAFDKRARAPAAADAAGDDIEILVAEPQHAAVAAAAQAHHRHHRVDHRLREVDAAAAVA